MSSIDLSKKYEKRWQAVKKFVETKINPILIDEQYVAALDGEIINVHQQLEIDNEAKEIIMRDRNCSHVIYNCNPKYDEGAHTPIRESIKELKQRIQIFKKVKY
jgi:hypothetical protein